MGACGGERRTAGTEKKPDREVIWNRQPGNRHQKIAWLVGSAREALHKSDARGECTSRCGGESVGRKWVLSAPRTGGISSDVWESAVVGKARCWGGNSRN